MLRHMNDLSAEAIGLLQRGDLEDARALFQFILDQRMAVFGADSPSIIIDLANLANVLVEQRQLHQPARLQPLDLLLAGVQTTLQPRSTCQSPTGQGRPCAYIA